MHTRKGTESSHKAAATETMFCPWSDASYNEKEKINQSCVDSICETNHHLIGGRPCEEQFQSWEVRGFHKQNALNVGVAIRHDMSGYVGDMPGYVGDQWRRLVS